MKKALSSDEGSDANDDVTGPRPSRSRRGGAASKKYVFSDSEDEVAEKNESKDWGPEDSGDSDFE